MTTFALILSAGAAAAQVIEIPDRSLDAAIRYQLEKPEGDLTVADIGTLTEQITRRPAGGEQFAVAVPDSSDCVGDRSSSTSRTHKTHDSRAD
jgi:hypothetical protein